MRLRAEESASVILSAASGTPMPAALSLQRELVRQRELSSRAHAHLATAPPWIQQLVLAADQFIVERRSPTGPPPFDRDEVRRSQEAAPVPGLEIYTPPAIDYTRSASGVSLHE